MEIGEVVSGASLALGMIGSVLAVIRAVAGGWHDWEPMGRALRRRATLLEQARDLELVGELTWAQRRRYVAEQVLARRLSRFELLQEYPLWSFISFIVPYLLVIGLPATILGALGMLSSGWDYWAAVWLGFQAVLASVLVVNMLVSVFWFDGKVKRRAHHRLGVRGILLNN